MVAYAEMGRLKAPPDKSDHSPETPSLLVQVRLAARVLIRDEAKFGRLCPHRYTAWLKYGVMGPFRRIGMGELAKKWRYGLADFP